MDIYTPVGDTVTNRPLILYMHGGSFYGGSKSMTDCIDFCETMAKKGYVTASLNYRLANIFSFLSSNETQYETVLKAVSDVKSAIRFFRKDFDFGNNYGIDPATIFVGGYSAGAVIAIHLAYIDSINDLPTSPIDVQSIVSNISGSYGLVGDAEIMDTQMKLVVSLVLLEELMIYHGLTKMMSQLLAFREQRT